jgi:hypothetical protein
MTPSSPQHPPPSSSQSCQPPISSPHLKRHPFQGQSPTRVPFLEGQSSHGSEEGGILQHLQSVEQVLALGGVIASHDSHALGHVRAAGDVPGEGQQQQQQHTQQLSRAASQCGRALTHLHSIMEAALSEVQVCSYQQEPYQVK